MKIVRHTPRGLLKTHLLMTVFTPMASVLLYIDGFLFGSISMLLVFLCLLYLLVYSVNYYTNTLDQMRLRLFEKYYTNNKFQGWYLIIFRSKLFQFRWFTDCGDWFLYIHLGRKYWRFSSAGFLKGKLNSKGRSLKL